MSKILTGNQLRISETRISISNNLINQITLPNSTRIKADIGFKASYSGISIVFRDEHGKYIVDFNSSDNQAINKSC